MKTLALQRQNALEPQNFEQAMQLAQMLARSEFAPKDMKGKPEACFLAIQWGYELGIGALQSVQNIAVINGRPAMWGDMLVALARANPNCEYINETFDEATETAICRVKRRNQPEEIRTFSFEDAKKAGLLGKQGPWMTYPKRMAQMRARAWALRDVFSDSLKGMAVAEEVSDYPVKHMGAAEIVQPPAQPAQQAGKATYTQEEFERLFPQWLAVIESGKQTADGLIAFVKTRKSLTPEQEAAIINSQQPAESTETGAA